MVANGTPTNAAAQKEKRQSPPSPTAADRGLPSNYRPTNSPNYTPPVNSGKRGFNLFVGTLPNTTTKDDLEILFSPFGSLTDTYLLKQEGRGRHRCGFVSFASYPSAVLAIGRLNGFVIHEHEPPMCVRFANPPKTSEVQAGAAQQIEMQSSTLSNTSIASEVEIPGSPHSTSSHSAAESTPVTSSVGTPKEATAAMMHSAPLFGMRADGTPADMDMLGFYKSQLPFTMPMHIGALA